jgi:tetrapyrrole methylase family protein/MazG family protein
MDETTHAHRLLPPDSGLPPYEQLRDIIAKLRGPGGCPWDREQTHLSLRGGLIEEAYEAAAAIEAGDDVNLREELGDLLLQVVFHSQIASDEKRFTLDEVAQTVSDKLIRRHPHVFGSESASNAAAVLVRWEEIKRAEKQAAGQPEKPPSALDGVTPGLPALMHAEKIQKRAAKVGFDWSSAAPVIEKVREEIAEVEEALKRDCPGELEDELGDLLFAAVNLARKLRIDPEVALRRATNKFTERFQQIERIARARGLSLEKMTLAEMDVVWDEVKLNGHDSR